MALFMGDFTLILSTWIYCSATPLCRDKAPEGPTSSNAVLLEDLISYLYSILQGARRIASESAFCQRRS
jgi:hypothetical protein